MLIIMARFSQKGVYLIYKPLEKWYEYIIEM